MILDGRKLEAADLKRINNVIKGGGIIAFPTDTVYGLGCDAFNTEAIARIYTLKKREKNKPFVLFVSNKDRISKYATLNTTAERLIDEFLPGPLTIIIESSDSSPSALVGGDDKIGVRIPDNGVILKVLEALPTPLATTSANPSGKEEAIRAEMVASVFADEELEIIIDGGLCDHSPSSVIDTTAIPPTLLRKGPVSIFEIERTLGCDIKLGEGVNLLVLFVCTGNSCRSPIASGLLREKLRGTAKRRTRIISAGTQASNGFPPTELAGRVARKHGIDISLYRSRILTKEILEEADLIISFEPRHLQRISQLLPDASSRSFLLKTFRKDVLLKDAFIRDPVGGDWEVYDRCINEIGESMDRLLNYVEDKFK